MKCSFRRETGSEINLFCCCSICCSLTRGYTDSAYGGRLTPPMSWQSFASAAGIYTIRLIRNNAYIGPSTKVSKISRNTAAIAVGSAFVALLLAIILVTSGAMDLSKLKGMKDNGAIILLLTSMIALVILGVTGAIRKKQNAVDDEEEKNKL